MRRLRARRLEAADGGPTTVGGVEEGVDAWLDPGEVVEVGMAVGMEAEFMPPAAKVGGITAEDASVGEIATAPTARSAGETAAPVGVREGVRGRAGLACVVGKGDEAARGEAAAVGDEMSMEGEAAVAAPLTTLSGSSCAIAQIRQASSWVIRYSLSAPSVDPAPLPPARLTKLLLLRLSKSM